MSVYLACSVLSLPEHEGAELLTVIKQCRAERLTIIIIKYKE